MCKSKIVSIRSLMISFSAFCCIAYHSVGFSQENTTLEELRNDLESDSSRHIIATLNRLKREKLGREILEFLLDVWNMKVEVHPDLSWSNLVIDTVRLEIADLLAQAAVNNRIDLNLHPLQTYVSRNIASDNSEVAVKSILILSIFDRDVDVDNVFSLATHEDKEIFRASVISLSRMCNSTAVHALDRLEEDIKDEKRRKFLQEVRENMERFKRSSRVCD